ncbi:methyltransferase domain-containing protein [Glycomyces dulcitolivorans]|uniref:class I SAM-dependent methyltransferase n=1 Tax=Glycomyces dulcitolivorans TaxID=2200759 RepID=UPI000DD3DBB4|nr:class I SAM-dependent methyltransferase [Glycomyces dulcitolivorans]
MKAEQEMQHDARATPVAEQAAAPAVEQPKEYVFPGSAAYWEQRYASGGNSGAGSRGVHAEFKAGVLNGIVAEHGVESVIEFGCGDGEQLSLGRYPRYLGLDVAPTQLRKTMARYADDPAKSFALYDPESFADPAGLITADMAMSLDVIYHLIEDGVYDLHLRHVFGAAKRFVVLFTSDADDPSMQGQFAPHLRHHPVPRDVAERFPEWKLREKIDNPRPWRIEGEAGSIADFYVYERIE